MTMFANKKSQIDTVVGSFFDALGEKKSSSLSPGTVKNSVRTYLKAHPLGIPDKILTVLDYRPCKIYDGSKKGSAPDITAEWFVYYSYRNPRTGKMERHKVFQGINFQKTIKLRKYYGDVLSEMYNELLRAGYSPYDHFNDSQSGDIDPGITNCIELYLSEKKKVLAPKSYAPYKQHVNFFRDWVETKHMAHLKISDFKRSNIKMFLSDYQTETKCSNRQINNIKNNIITFFNYFVNNFEEIISKNPAAKLKDLPYTTEGNRAYTDKQIAQLKETMIRDNPNMLFFCEMVYETCGRPHEEVRLFRVRDLEFDQNRIHVRPELSKEGRSEYIPMSARYMEKLKDYIKGAKETDYLFCINRHPGKKGGGSPFTPGEAPISEKTLQEWYAKIKKNCGMGGEWSIYSWAHSYCCRAYLDTKDIFFIKEKKRHSDLAVTSNYLRGLGLFVDLQKIAENVRGF